MAPVLHGRRCIHAPADLCVFGDLQPERRFYVHRLLLMCISPYFEKVFRYRAVSGGPVADCAHCTLAGSSHDARTPCTHQTTGDQQKQNSQRSSKRDLSLLELTSEKPKASRSTTLTPDNKENESSPRPQFNDSTHEEPAAAASHSRHDTFVGTALVSNTISLDRPGTSDPIDLSGQLLSTSNAQSTTKGSSPTKSTNLKKKDKFLQVCDCISNNATNDKHRTSTGVSRSEMLSCQTFESLLSSLAPKMEDTTHQWFDALPPFLSPPSHDQPLEQLKLSGLDGNQVEALIQFAYDGKIELTAGNVQSLLLASDMYSVQSLFDQCQQFLIDSLGTSNCVGVYVFSQKMQCARLETAVEHYILRNFELVSTRSVEFPHLLSEEQMLKLLLQHRLYVSDEYLVFLAIVRWIQFDKLKRASSFAKLFTGVRLALVSDQHLVESMLPHPLLNSHPQFKQLIERVLLCKSQLQLFERPDEQLLHDFELQAHLTPRFPLDLIFVFGGRTLDVEFVPPEPVVEVYDHRAERWRQVSSLQEPLSTRDHHQTVVLDGDIYLLGGHSGPFNVYNSCRKFSLKTKKWVEIAPMREKRAFLAAVVWNKSIYAIGGYNGAWRVDTAEKYNRVANQWQTVASMHERRSGAGAAVLNDRIYVVGGFRDLTYLNTAEFYCPQTNTWTVIGLMQKPRSSPSVVSMNGFVYAIGGLTAGGLLSSAERYDPATGTWTLLEREMLEKKCSAAAVVLEGKIFVIGGWNGVAGLNTVELWCPHSKRWLLGSKLSKRRTGCSACVVQDVAEIELYAWHSREQLLHERFHNAFVETATDSSPMQIEG